MPYWFDTYRALGLDHLSNFRVKKNVLKGTLSIITHSFPPP